MWSKFAIIFVILAAGLIWIPGLNIVYGDSTQAELPNPELQKQDGPIPPASGCLPGLQTIGDPNNPGCQRVDFISFLRWLFPFMLSVAAFLAVLMIVIAGTRWVTSAGSEAEIKAAKDMMKNAVVGLILAFAAWLIIWTINPDILKNLRGQIKTDIKIALIDKI